MVNQARKRGRKPRANLAVSAVIGNLIMVSITMTLGYALWTTVNSTAGTTLQRYTDQTVSDINEINEDFVITVIAFDYPSTGKVTIWFYNNGGLDTEINQIFNGTDPASLAPVVTFTPDPLILAKGTSGSVEFDQISTLGTTYYIKVVAKYGNTASSYEER